MVTLKMAAVRAIKPMDEVHHRQVRVRRVPTITNVIQLVRIRTNTHRAHQLPVTTNNNNNNNNTVEPMVVLVLLIAAMVNLSMAAKVVMTIQVICIFVVVKDVFVAKRFVCPISQVLFDKFDIECQRPSPTYSNVFIFVVNQVKSSKKSSKNR